MKLFHSPQHHPAVHTFQTVTRGKKSLVFRSSKEIRGRQLLDSYKRNFTVAVQSYTGCGTGRWGVSTAGIQALCSGPWSVLLTSYTTADENNWACSTRFRWCFWKPGLAYGLHFQSKHSLPSTNVVWTLNTQLVKLWEWKTLP